MKILSHKFGGIGTFRDDASLPIEELGDARVVAVTGENGAGKTTALELIPGAFYLTTPSRGALAGLANRRDSFVETMVRIGETDLIARVMINGTARTKTTEAYLIDAGTNDPITDGKVKSFKAEIARRLPPASAYLASAFAAQGGEGRFLDLPVVKRKELFASLLGLGHLETMAEAAGAKAREAQLEATALEGRAAELSTTASRGAVAASFLIEAQGDLRRATEDLELAEAKAREATEALDRWREKSKDIDERAASSSQEKEKAIRVRDGVSDALKAQREAGERVAVAEAEVNTAATRLSSAMTDNHAAAEKLRAWTGEREKLAEAWRAAKGEADAADRRAAEILADLGRSRVELQNATNRRNDLDDQIASVEELRDIAERRGEHLERIEELGHELAASKQAETAHAEVVIEWSTKCSEARVALGLATADHRIVMDTALAEYEKALLEVERARLGAKDLDNVPCGGDGAYSTCPLIETATLARGSVEGLEDKTAAAQAAMDAIDAEPEHLDELRASAEQLEQSKPGRGEWRNVEYIETDLAGARSSLSAADHAVAKIEALEPAKIEHTRIELERGVLIAKIGVGDDAAKGSAEAAGEALSTQTDARIAGETHKRTEPPGPVDSELVAARAASSAAATEMGASREAAATAEAAIAETGDDLDAAIEAATAATDAEYSALRDAEEHRAAKPEPAIEADVNTLRDVERDALIAESEARAVLDATTEAREKLAAVRADLERITGDLDDWRHLQTAFGRNGIQALEIDAAGPEVSDLCNQLLHSCYNSRFTVALETAALKADGKGTKEVFDLRVIDTERGTDGSADQLSGGEKVLISEALSLAICIYNARRSGVPMEDLFRDECAGALSAINATRYISMLRRALDLGGFARVYFVAHQEHLWALADAQLIVAEGAIKVAA